MKPGEGLCPERRLFQQKLISKYTYADIDFYQFGAKTLELTKTAAILYKNALPEEKRELLNFLLLNSTLLAQKPQFNYTKPFDRVL